jgi:hypothetical protein
MPIRNTADKRLATVDYNLIRKLFANQITAVTGLLAILEEPEGPVDKRPPLPYFSYKIMNPGMKSGDDSKAPVPDTSTQPPTPTSIWNSGGVRKMMVDFNVYATSHEEAFNYMMTWQTALDLEDVQAALRLLGVAVWVIGNVADLSKLLNTGYEGRAHLDCSFGIAANLQSDLGSIDSVTVTGTVSTPGVQEELTFTATDT